MIPISLKDGIRAGRAFLPSGESTPSEEQDECLRGGKEFKRRRPTTLRSLSPSVLLMDRLSPGVNSLMPLDNGWTDYREIRVYLRVASVVNIIAQLLFAHRKTSDSRDGKNDRVIAYNQ